MKSILQSICLLLFFAVVVSSCMVTNNLYVNDPIPVKKGAPLVYLGTGTGIAPKIDSVSNGTNAIHFTNKISRAPILSIGAQFRATDHLGIRAAAHFPYILGGFGLRGGVQYSFFNAGSKFNTAIGADLGFVITRDSIKILGQRTEVNNETEGGFNADFFLPIGCKVNKNLSFVITPRYSFNAINVKKKTNESATRTFRLYAPMLSLGVRIHGFYIEASAVYYKNTIHPHAGVAFIIPSENKVAAKK